MGRKDCKMGIAVMLKAKYGCEGKLAIFAGFVNFLK